MYFILSNFAPFCPNGRFYNLMQSHDTNEDFYCKNYDIHYFVINFASDILVFLHLFTFMSISSERKT